MSMDEMDYWSSLFGDLKRSSTDADMLEAKMLDLGCPHAIVECLLSMETE